MAAKGTQLTYGTAMPHVVTGTREHHDVTKNMTSGMHKTREAANSKVRAPYWFDGIGLSGAMSVMI